MTNTAKIGQTFTAFRGFFSHFHIAKNRAAQVELLTALLQTFTMPSSTELTTKVNSGSPYQLDKSQV